ncbi:MAG: hypothetical protein GY842_12675 [bacterium]|nr:hypothetical protein [bacterium]
MDPNLFHLDWDRLVEALAAIVVLAFVLERALSVVFEHRLYIERLGSRGYKEVIALTVALMVCWYWDFDAISMILLKEHTTFIGEVLTAGIIAGGSKGSVKLFRDVMGFGSTVLKEEEAKASGGKSARKAAAKAAKKADE